MDQRLVDEFNAKHKPGHKVTLRMDDGSQKEVTVKYSAELLGGHTAVAWFEEIRGAYALNRLVNSEGGAK